MNTNDRTAIPMATPSVGQLAKPICPTPKPKQHGALTVGRHQNQNLKIPKINQLKKAIKANQKLLQNPESQQAQRAVTEIQVFIRLAKHGQPKIKVYFGYHSYLPHLKPIFLPLQYQLFKKLVEAFAIIHHQSRSPYKDGIIVDYDDYHSALRILKHKAPKKRIKVLHRGRHKLLAFLQQNYQHRVFSSRSLRIDTGYSHSYLKELLKQLSREGLIKGHREKRNQYIKYRLVKRDYSNELQTTS